VNFNFKKILKISLNLNTLHFSLFLSSEKPISDEKMEFATRRMRLVQLFINRDRVISPARGCAAGRGNRVMMACAGK